MAVYLCETFGILAFLSFLTRRVSFGIAILYALDFWTAAGLLRLSEDSAWGALLVAGTVIVLRKLTSFSLKANPSAARIET